MLGLTGAISADLMMQLFGIATIALLFPIAAWGWRLVTHRVLTRERSGGAVDRWRARRRELCVVPCRRARPGRADRPWRRCRRCAAARAGLAIRRAAVGRDALYDRDRHRIATFIALFLAAGFGWRETEEDEAEKTPKKKAPSQSRAEQAADEEEEAETRTARFVSLGWLYHSATASRRAWRCSLPC